MHVVHLLARKGRGGMGTWSIHPRQRLLAILPATAGVESTVHLKDHQRPIWKQSKWTSGPKDYHFQHNALLREVIDYKFQLERNGEMLIQSSSDLVSHL